MTDSSDPPDADGDEGPIRSLVERVEPAGLQDRGVDWEPLLAGLASLVVPGAGQWYNDQPARAAALLTVAVALLLSYVLVGETAILVGLFVEPLLRLFAGYDAYATRRELGG